MYVMTFLLILLTLLALLAFPYLTFITDRWINGWIG